MEGGIYEEMKKETLKHLLLHLCIIFLQMAPQGGLRGMVTHASTGFWLMTF